MEGSRDYVWVNEWVNKRDERRGNEKRKREKGAKKRRRWKKPDGCRSGIFFTWAFLCASGVIPSVTASRFFKLIYSVEKRVWTAVPAERLCSSYAPSEQGIITLIVTYPRAEQCCKIDRSSVLIYRGNTIIRLSSWRRSALDDLLNFTRARQNGRRIRREPAIF